MENPEQEEDVYGGEFPEEGDMDADVDMAAIAEAEAQEDPNTKVRFRYFLSLLIFCV